MGIRIKIADTAGELDAVFALRHRVFVGEGYMTPTHDGRVYDRFDAFPGTTNIVAMRGAEVIGGIRYMEPTEVGSSVDEFFDPRPLAPPGARLAVGSLLVLDPRFRGFPRITFNMTAMGFYWAASRGLTHIVGVVNPDREEGFARSGFRRLGPPIQSERIRKVPVQPMIADVDALDDRFMVFLMRQNVAHWLYAFERQFHSAGDTVFRRGEPGGAAFVVVSGRADVLDSQEQEVVAHVEPGDLFGEVALLASSPRTATVRAETDLDLMVIDGTVLRAQLRENPRAAEGMLELLASRLAVSMLGDAAPSSVMRAAKLRRPLDKTAHPPSTKMRRHRASR
jgi:CRP/FNR family cyclic AMP-dependent transcriptional regulator